jgi:hypothetical protein
MTNISTKRSDKVSDDQAMIDGVQKFLGKLAQLPVGSQMVTPDQIVQVYKDRLAAGQAVITAEAARAAAIAVEKDKRTSTAAFVRSFRRMLQGMFSASPDTLAVFHLTPVKAPKRTVATKSAAVAQSKATRAARGTKGKKQKAQIKGAVVEATNVAPAPAPAPATPAPTATPAPKPAP